MTLILGAVAYDPKVVTIWEGFKRYFRQQGLSFDYVLYSNYERQVEALLDGTIHVAWNSPLAWVRSRRMARARHLTGAADAACMIESNYHLFGAEGVLQPGSTRVLSPTPCYDHCNMTAGPVLPSALIERFRELLLGMSYADPEARLLFDLEGLKAWKEGREEGYEQLESAVDALGFYDRQGNITCID